MQAFEDAQRTDAGPAAHGEPIGRFLDRVSGEYWDAVRHLINDWFGRFCLEAQADLRSRLRSTDDRQFVAAFFELYLHESLVRSGYTVSCHPALSGTSRRPDFLAQSASGSFYLEARSINSSDSAVAVANRRSRIYNAINGVNSPNFFISVSVDEEAPTDPRTGPLRAELEKWLEPLDPDVASASVAASDFSALPTYAWRRDGWHVTFRAIPKAPGSRGPDTGLRPLGAWGPGQAYAVDDSTPLKSALSEKGKAYGDFEFPYVVAVNTSTLTSDDFDVTNVLYGTQLLQLGTTSRGASFTRATRANDGYWLGSDGWLHSNVAAVLVVRNVTPWNVGGLVPTLWHHPQPGLAAASGVPIWRHIRATASGLEEVAPSQSPTSFFELGEPWPPRGPLLDA